MYINIFGILYIVRRACHAYKEIRQIIEYNSSREIIYTNIYVCPSTLHNGIHKFVHFVSFVSNRMWKKKISIIHRTWIKCFSVYFGAMIYMRQALEEKIDIESILRCFHLWINNIDFNESQSGRGHLSNEDIYSYVYIHMKLQLSEKNQHQFTYR